MPAAPPPPPPSVVPDDDDDNDDNDDDDEDNDNDADVISLFVSTITTTLQLPQLMAVVGGRSEPVQVLIDRLTQLFLM
jgi:hypothetical protein